MATKSVKSLPHLFPDVPLSVLIDNSMANQVQPDLNSLAGTAPPTRGRGRPPKPKPEILQNGQSSPQENPVSANEPNEEAQPAKRPRGRPRKNGTPSGTSQEPPTAATETGEPIARSPSRRGRGRPSKSKPFSAMEMESPSSKDGSRKRGRPKKADSATKEAEDPESVTPAKKRGRPSKIHQNAIVGAAVPAEEAAENGGPGPERNHKFLQEKIKEAVKKMKEAVSALEEVQAVAAEAMNFK